MAPLRHGDLAHPVGRVGEFAHRDRRRNPGAQPVEARLNRDDGLVAAGRLQELLRGGDDILIDQGLSDDARRITWMHLEDNVVVSVAAKIGRAAEHGLPQG